MAEIRIGIDLDGVLYNWGDTARELIRVYHGIEVGESTSWNYISEQVPPDVWSWLWDEGISFGLFRDGAAYLDGLAAVRDLATAGRIVIITARPESARADTVAWLAHRVPAAEVHILSGKAPKSSVPCDVYVDDNSDNVAELAANTPARVFLLDRPWNQGDLFVPGVERAFGWGVVHQAVSRIGSVQLGADLPPIIGLTGHKQAGKDTIAAMLANWGYDRLGFADPLKKMALAIDPMVQPDPESSPCSLAALVSSVGWEEAKRAPDVRRFLQRLGTDGVRDHLGDGVWVEALRQRLRPDERYVIADLRFPNEAEAVRSWRGEVWKVVRPGYDGDDHASERGVDEIEPDRVIANDGTLDDLWYAVVRALDSEGAAA